jgi:tetratricopeptide (TPR) repeat protein
VALRRAGALYDRGRRAAAARIFARYSLLEARVGVLLARWPDRSASRLERLARRHPRSSFVLLHLGLARYWLRKPRAARRAWREAVARDPDTASAQHAADLLHPQFPRGVPEFVPSFRPPAALARLATPRQLAQLASAARRGGVRAKLAYGVALQRLGRQGSAEAQYAAAAALAPHDPEAQAAAAVGLFTKDDPARAFARLGPLTQRFERAPTIRFHLALLLLWTAQVEEAKRQLRLARAEGPTTPIGREANAFLAALQQGSKQGSVPSRGR